MDTNGKTILVIGATGQQGGAVARHLLNDGWHIRALTRDASKPAAIALRDAGAEIVTGDLNDRASLDAALQGVYGVFSVQEFYTQGVEGEERQGKRVADAAKAAGIQHLVYSSVGSADQDTGLHHFDSKWHIEQHIRALGIPATILRPVFFMDNFNFMGIDSGAIGIRPTTKLQMIAVDDIGRFAALAFANPDEYIGKAIDLAGDELTMPEAAAIFSRHTGKNVQFVPPPVDAPNPMGDEGVRMFRWFDDVGYHADIPALRRALPELHTLEAWLRDEMYYPMQMAW